MRVRSTFLALIFLAGCSDDDGAAQTTTAEESADGRTDDESTDPDESSSTTSADASEVGTGDGDGDAGDGDAGDGDGEAGDGDGEAGDGDSEAGDGDGDPLPNINMDMVADIIQDSVYTQTIPFTANACAYMEGCIDDIGMRRLLRFDTLTTNDGDVDLEIGHAGLDPENFEWGECHDHYHYKDFAFYRLLEKDTDRVVVSGHKQAFALIDVVQMLPNAGPPKFPLPDDSQGITVGWADVYGHYLDCQWVDITGVPSGEYRLEISINPNMVFAEKSYDDNLILMDVTIGDEDDGPPPVPASWTCLDSYYDDDDGCHCGCGVVDPDCENPTAEACDSCDISGSCAQGLACDAIMSGNNAQCN